MVQMVSCNVHGPRPGCEVLVCACQGFPERNRATWAKWNRAKMVSCNVQVPMTGFHLGWTGCPG